MHCSTQQFYCSVRLVELSREQQGALLLLVLLKAAAGSTQREESSGPLAELSERAQRAAEDVPACPPAYVSREFPQLKLRLVKPHCLIRSLTQEFAKTPKPSSYPNHPSELSLSLHPEL